MARQVAEMGVLSLPLIELRDRLASGALRVPEVARACLDRIRAVEPGVQAWAWLDEDHIWRQTR